MPAASRFHPAAPAASIFRVNLNIRGLRSHPFMILGGLHRRTRTFVVNRTNIAVSTTEMMWFTRDVRTATGNGLCFLRVEHHQNVIITSEDVTAWMMATLPTIQREHIQVTQNPHVEIRAEDHAHVENMFYPMIIRIAEPPLQT